MAYAALVSLKETIERLMNLSHPSIVPPPLEMLQVAYDGVHSVRQSLVGVDRCTRSSCINRERMNAFDGEIRDAICKLEVVLEFYVSNQFVSQSEERFGDDDDEGCSLMIPSPDLEDVMQEIGSFTQTAKMMEEEVINISEFFNLSPSVSSRSDDAGPSMCKMMVGLSDEFNRTRHRFLANCSTEFEIVSFVGMAGIGKTTFARKLFEDPSVCSRFDRRVWLTVGPNYELKKFLQNILAQMNPEIDDTIFMEGDHDELMGYLNQSLSGRRCLIVLDDVWSKEIGNDLKTLFQHDKNGSRLFLTTRLLEVALYASGINGVNFLRQLNREESWDLLREKVFGEELCPPQLKIAGKRIADECEGLPLLIVTVADLLSKAEKTTLEFWNEVAEKKNSVFEDAHDQVLEVIYPSYQYLSHLLKPCLLYMGVFPQKYDIPRSKLIKLWIAEGFLQPDPSMTKEDGAEKCLEALCSRSLIVIYEKSSMNGIKTCGLHSVFWHLCNKEAERSKFFHILNRSVDSFAEGMESQRRLCIHNNVLLAIKDVHESIASISIAHSLLCTGLPHRYPVPICSSLRLLRVLDTLTIRFYEFPMEVVLKLFHLRYLSLTYSANLPTSISKLWNLQFLIVRQHLTIKSAGDSSYLPVEIWDMKELKHIQVMGSNLPNPCEGSLLPNLLTLLDVSSHSCTKVVLERIPNLEKLGIRIELAPDVAAAAVESLSCFDHISHLHKLESLKCVIVNPELGSEGVVAPPLPLSIISSGLKKLSLSGFGYPWEDMSTISLLQNLEVLKLRGYAFRGPIWVTNGKFLRLKSLLIEDTDIELWIVEEDNFPVIERLNIRFCYKLETIVPWETANSKPPSLQSICLVDCTAFIYNLKS